MPTASHSRLVESFRLVPSEALAAEDALAQMMPWLMRFVVGGPSAARLTLQHLRVLFAVPHGERRSGPIAAEIGIQRSAATRTINSLSRHGLITRRRDPVDQRIVLVGLTPSGRALCRGLMFATDRRCRRLMEVLRPSEARAA
jgi:DNA-binding MarR family transcriptional regulator